jgi:hypothetical protein
MTFEILELTTRPDQRQRFDIALQAEYCVNWLEAQGLEVISVEKGTIGPRITIHSSPLCDLFEEVSSAYERGMQGERRYSFIYRFGCEVRWVEGCAEQSGGVQ